MARPIKICKSYLILCEGRDAEGFLINYLNSKALKFDKRFSDEIQVFDFGGNDDLKVFLSNITKVDGFENVTSLLIIRDAELDKEKAISQIKSALGYSNIVMPKTPAEWMQVNESLKIAYVLWPKCNSNPINGTLEDLCMQIIDDKDRENITNSIQVFINDMKNNYERNYTHEFKAKLHTYMSVTEPFIGMKIGEASKANMFDWNSDKLMDLRKIIEEGFLE